MCIFDFANVRPFQRVRRELSDLHHDFIGHISSNKNILDFYASLLFGELLALFEFAFAQATKNGLHAQHFRTISYSTEYKLEENRINDFKLDIHNQRS